ncbi:hypothetical protein GALL_427320 [mine drainage metagenome]|uniref:Uncharacterized protein n=1 Tax=mine drainage metagenome TaxID=410659 RepID=A0A1J5PVV8_9ZZZZ
MPRPVTDLRAPLATGTFTVYWVKAEPFARLRGKPVTTRVTRYLPLRLLRAPRRLTALLTTEPSVMLLVAPLLKVLVTPATVSEKLLLTSEPSGAMA